jgi:deoxyribodipyrimidine photo-lyase
MNRLISIIWFRRDLRVADNPALAAASSTGEPVVPLFVLDDDSGDRWAPSEVSNERQRQSLANLARDFAARGSRLVVRKGHPRDVLDRLTQEHPTATVFWNRRYEPHARTVEREVAAALKSRGIGVNVFDGDLLFEPGSITTAAGTPYRVFTAFWRACVERMPGVRSKAVLRELNAPNRWPSSTIDISPPTEDVFELTRHLDTFLDDYETLRDRPDHDATSRLSDRLHFGEIGPRELWHSVTEHAVGAPAGRQKAAEAFLRQLVWREFAHHLLYHYPDTPDTPMRPEFKAFPWREDASALERWKAAQTGYPFVDAGMRQLAQTGWMHNRVRMVAASFLVKHLLIDWRHGARHFWATLKDADLANNTMGWQWVAGCGVDAAPYFRIFNPIRQGERFDPDGSYVRRWIPEIASLPNRCIHKPWLAPESTLTKCAVRLGDTYPHPVVKHDFARERALGAYRQIKPAARAR